MSNILGFYVRSRFAVWVRCRFSTVVNLISWNLLWYTDATSLVLVSNILGFYVRSRFAVWVRCRFSTVVNLISWNLLWYTDATSLMQNPWKHGDKRYTPDGDGELKDDEE